MPYKFRKKGGGTLKKFPYPVTDSILEQVLDQVK
jgi:hypothetical protein